MVLIIWLLQAAYGIVTGLQGWFVRLDKTFIAKGYWRLIPEGLKNTMLISLGALAIGVFIGTLIAIIKYFAEITRSTNFGGKLLRFGGRVCDLYTTVIRGVPVMVLLMVLVYAIFTGTREPLLVCILGFGINSGAYVAEIIRSGVASVDRGQMEAGRSLGLSNLKTMRKIILPQAIRTILPAIGNEMIALIKETSVAGYVGVFDLTSRGNQIRNLTYDAINPLIAVALIYLIIVVVLTKLLRLLERRLNRDKRA